MFLSGRKQSLALVLITLVSMMSFVFSSQAAAPTNIVTYQGRLLNSNSVPVSDTSLSMKFFFYTAVTGGTCVWSNSSATCNSNTPASTTARTVTLTSGLFTQNLGDTGDSFAAISDSIFADNSTLFLEVIVGSETLSPRRRLTAAPYALNAQTLDGIDSGSFLRDTGDTATGDYDLTGATLSGGSPIVLEGASANSFETTLALTDPTADRTITFQNGSGTVAFLTDVTGGGLWESGTFVYEDDSAVVVGADAAFTYASGGVGDLRVADQLEVLDDIFVDNDLVVGASTSSTETIANSSFSLGGNDFFAASDVGVEGNVYIDGAIDLVGTATVGDLACTDCLDFAELVDALSLDASTSIALDGSETFSITNGGTGNVITNLSSTGDFVIQDNGAAILTVADDDVLTYSTDLTTTSAIGFTGNSLTTGSLLNLSATGLTTGTALTVTASNVSTANSASVLNRFVLTNSQSTIANTGITGLSVGFTNAPSIAGNTERVVSISNESTTNTTDNLVTALLALDNADTSTTGSTVVTDAISIAVSGAIANGIVDAIDASDANITNALNIGTNTILGTTGVIDFSSFDVDGSGNVTANDFICTDCVDFTEMIDAMSLDASTSIAMDGSETYTLTNGGTGNVVTNLSSTGDFVIQDNGAAVLTVADNDVFTYTTDLTTTSAMTLTGNSLTTGSLLNLSSTALTTGSALSVVATNANTANSSTRLSQFSFTNSQATVANGDIAGLFLNFTNSPSIGGNTERAMSIVNAPTSNTTDNAVAALLSLDNADTSGTGSTVITDALSITVSGAISDGIVDAIDASDSNITNALNVGANTITGTTAVIDFNSFDVDNSGIVTASDYVCTDCIDFAELIDSMSLDASTSIAMDGSENFTVTNGGTGNMVVNLSSTGDFVLQDSGSPFFSINDNKVISYSTDLATSNAVALTGNSLTTANLLTLTSTALTTGSALSVTASNTNTANSISSMAVFALTNAQSTVANDDVNGLVVRFTNNPSVAGNNERAMVVTNLATSNTTDNAVQALLNLDNGDTSATGSTVVTNALIVSVSGSIADGIIDAVDASDSNITNALNIGSNIITGTTGVIDFNSFDVGPVASANSGTTTSIVDVGYVTPVDTSGTNIHQGITIDMDIGNSTGGTNSVNALELEGMTGDPEVANVHAIDIGALTGSAATNETALQIGTGWDADIAFLNATQASLRIPNGSRLQFQDSTSTEILTLQDVSNSLNHNLAIDADTGLSFDSNADSDADITTPTAEALRITPGGVGDVIFTIDADSNVQMTAGVAPGVDMLSLSNSGFATTTTDVNGLQIDFSSTGAAAQALFVETTYVGGATDALNFDGIFIGDINPTNAAGTDTVAGIHIGTITDPGANITSTGLRIDAGYDANIAIIDSSSVFDITNGGTLAFRDTSNTIMLLTDNGSDGVLSINNISTADPAVNVYDVAVNTTIDIGGVTNDSANSVNIATNATSGDTISIGNTAGGTNVTITAGGTIDLEGSVTADLAAIGATQFALCHTNSDTNDEPIGDCSGAPTADYAEQYPVETGISYGDIVVPGAREVTTTEGQTITQLVKSSEPYQGPIAGIVSNNYGDFTSAGYNIEAGDNPMPIALVGRVPVKVTNEGGAIQVGDYLTTSSTAGRAMKASKVGRVIGMALQNWDGVSDTIMVQVNNSWYMGEVIGTDGVSTLVTDNVVVSSFATATAEAPTFDSYGLSLRGSVWNGSEAEAVEMMMKNVVDSEDEYRLSIRNTSETEVAYITDEGTMKIAGDMIVGGNLYPSDRGVPQTDKYIYYDGSEGSAGDFMRTNAKGWSTGSYDFAEMFPSSETLEAGEVVAFSGSGHDVIRATGAQGEQLAGIVSTRPGFLAGENIEGSYPIALAGRVPTKVSEENGAIAIGDPLTSSATTGLAVKASESGQIVGYALEAYDGSQSDDLILVYVNIGYWQDDTVVQNTASEVSGNTNFSALNMTGNISMNSYEINGIGKLTGMGDSWSLASDGTLTTSGLLKTVIDSYQNEKVETVAVTSPEVMITLTGTAVLENDQLEIRFEDVIPEYNDVISADAPIRVFVTPHGPVSLYVSESDQNHFVVTRFQGDLDVEFDWMVSAYRKGYEPEEEVEEVDEVDMVDPGFSMGATEETESSDTESEMTADSASPESPDTTIVDQVIESDGGATAEPETQSP